MRAAHVFTDLPISHVQRQACVHKRSSDVLLGSPLSAIDLSGSFVEYPLIFFVPLQFVLEEH